MKAWTVEVLREVIFVEWGTRIVFAETKEEAEQLAQPLADDANSKPDWECPFEYQRDDGDASDDWRVANVVPATDEDIDGEEHLNEPSD